MPNNLISNIWKGMAGRIQRLSRNKYQKAGFSPLKEIIIKHLPDKGVQTIRFMGKQLTFNGKEGLLHSLQEIFLDDIYLQSLPANAFIIDCGANIGLSVIYLKKLCPGARIIAFEPDEISYSLLQKNIRSFELTQVEARKEAIWKENTELSFLNEGTLGSKIAEAGKAAVVKVKATRLKDLMNERIDFLKLDIEGAEYEVLKDIETSLKNVEHLFIEYHGSRSQNKELNEILQIITNNGFYYYIKEAAPLQSPFTLAPVVNGFDIQLNIFCLKCPTHGI